MGLEVATPAAFLLLAALPVAWLAGRAGFAARVRRFHVCVRTGVLVCLVTALAQPVLSLPASRVAVIYLVDASNSVATQALQSAAAAIDAMNTAVRPDQSRILVFGRQTAHVEDTGHLRRLAGDTARVDLDRLVSAGGTNLEQALAAARAEIPPSANGRIVLFSDGRETEGSSLRLADRLAADRVSVFTDPTPVRDVGDTWVEDLRLTGAPVADAVAALEVVVASQSGGAVEVRVSEGGKVLAREQRTLPVGTSTVAMEVVFDTHGTHLLEAEVSADDDTLADNNTLQREVVVESRPRVLWIAAAAGAPDAAPFALARSGMEVTRAAPADLPRSAAALDPWDVVVLSNVARTALSTESMSAIGAWVEQRGGGLLFIGGGAVVGESLDNPAAGYRHTEIERLLPVTFDRDDEPEVALVIVLDRSWSMHGPAMELSKSAAEAAALTLAPAQMLGVLTFNNTSEWDVPLSRVRDTRATLHEAIGAIQASGPTAIYPALERAYQALGSIQARAKHVILLSDGQTAPDDYEQLVRRMAVARMTVSSVALGPEADVELLRNLATWGGGRHYVVADARQIPEIFVKEAKGAATPGYDEGGAIRAVVRQAELFGGDPGLPGLLGRNVVSLKPQAIDLLSTARGEPLLTTWPAGIGQTAMLAVDVEGRWTRDWLNWRGFGAFLSTVVRSVQRRRPPLLRLEVIPGDGPPDARTVALVFEARDAAGNRSNLLTPEVNVSTDAGGGARVSLAQVAPGRYQTRVVADTTRPLRFAVEAADGDGALRYLVPDPAAEYRLADADERLLEALARATGGVMRPGADDLRRAPRSAGVERHPLAPWFVAIGLLLWLADIAVRRLWR